MNEPLIVKYRPKTFSEVLGHENIIAALERVLKSNSRPHAFLFTGKSGVGKTSLARIIANEINADVLEVDAASNNGIDAIRYLEELGQYQSLSGAETKMFIVDECHSLSRQAWQALLKTLEEPPSHLYIALCTTELSKIPETILTRCYQVKLNPIKDNDIDDLLTVVCELEGWQVNSDVLDVVVASATGQPRKALSALQACYDAPSREEAQRIVALLSTSEPLTEMLRLLISGNKVWTKIRKYLADIEDDQFEGIIEHVGRYIIAILLKEEDEVKAQKLWQMLEALVFPAATFDRKASFIAAVGRILWS